MATINAQTRDGVGKGVARSLRRNQQIPVVLYGAGQANLNLSVSRKEFLHTIEQVGHELKTKPQTLIVDGNKKELVLLRDLHRHPVSDLPLHADFLRFDPNKPIVIEVPVEILDEEKCIGVKRGGMVQLICHAMEVHCLAGNIPENIPISVATLDIGDAVHVADLKLPEGVEIHDEHDLTIVSVVGVKSEESSESDSA